MQEVDTTQGCPEPGKAIGTIDRSIEFQLVLLALLNDKAYVQIKNTITSLGIPGSRINFET